MMASLNVLSNNFAGYELNGAFVLWLISFRLTVVGFFILNWTIQTASVPIKSALIAGLFSAVVFELLKNLFGFIMSNFTSYEVCLWCLCRDSNFPVMDFFVVEYRPDRGLN